MPNFDQIPRPKKTKCSIPKDLSKAQKEDEEVWKEFEPIIREERKKLFHKHYET